MKGLYVHGIIQVLPLTEKITKLFGKYCIYHRKRTPGYAARMRTQTAGFGN